MKFKKLGCLVLAFWSLGTAAQMETEAWKESETPPPPAFSADKLIPLFMPHYVTLRIGIDRRH